jgi:hypothetical protein
MQEPHEAPEPRERLEAWLDRYAVTPRADLERLLSNLPPQEAQPPVRSQGGRVASGAMWGGLIDLWRPAALAALPVLLGFVLSSALPTENSDSWEASEQWVFAAGGEGYYP